MSQFSLQRPRFGAALRLRCPRCGITPLLRKGSWFQFEEGCHRCAYRYEREPGYFWGAPWMINYPLVAVLTLILAVWYLRSDLHLHSLVLATVISTVAVGMSLLIYPLARSLWMYGDHFFHPLNENDAWNDSKDPSHPK